VPLPPMGLLLMLLSLTERFWLLPMLPLPLPLPLPCVPPMARSIAGLRADRGAPPAPPPAREEEEECPLLSLLHILLLPPPPPPLLLPFAEKEVRGVEPALKGDPSPPMLLLLLLLLLLMLLRDPTLDAGDADRARGPPERRLPRDCRELLDDPTLLLLLFRCATFPPVNTVCSTLWGDFIASRFMTPPAVGEKGAQSMFFLPILCSCRRISSAFLSLIRSSSECLVKLLPLILLNGSFPTDCERGRPLTAAGLLALGPATGTSCLVLRASISYRSSPYGPRFAGDANDILGSLLFHWEVLTSEIQHAIYLFPFTLVSSPN
jgi:hypothetical protein